MPDSDDALLEELSEAISKVRHELEIRRSPSTIGGGDSRGVIADLEAALQRRLEARARL